MIYEYNNPLKTYQLILEHSKIFLIVFLNWSNCLVKNTWPCVLGLQNNIS